MTGCSDFHFSTREEKKKENKNLLLLSLCKKESNKRRKRVDSYSMTNILIVERYH